MQTVQINTVKTHLAMSVNDFSTLHYRSSHPILPPTHNMAWMTSDSAIFWHPGFVCRTKSFGCASGSHQHFSLVTTRPLLLSLSTFIQAEKCAVLIYHTKLNCRSEELVFPGRLEASWDSDGLLQARGRTASPEGNKANL